MVLFEMVKGWVSGEEPKIGEMHSISHPHR
jgi:hypothetical protein